LKFKEQNPKTNEENFENLKMVQKIIALHLFFLFISISLLFPPFVNIKKV